jgi:sulfate adenylyltransferase
MIPAHGSDAQAGGLARPHGGALVWLVKGPADSPPGLVQPTSLATLRLDARERSDLLMLATGAFSPLRGFLDREAYRSVLAEMKLPDGTVWPIPVTLAVGEEEVRRLRLGAWAALADGAGCLMGGVRVESLYRAHPGVAYLAQRPPWLVGGEVLLFPQAEEPSRSYRLTPGETRAEAARRGWKRMVGFQTRNPLHRAHEYLVRCALELSDGLLLSPLVGETKAGDVPAPVRLRCYEALLDRYLPRERVLLVALDVAMRYAGPREALFHALIRKNFGCTHFIVGRDHAGVGNFYGPFDAQRIFDRFAPEEIGIEPLCFDNAFACRRCGGMATTKTCPHGAEDRVSLSGSRVRELLANNELPPPEVTRPEVADILLEAYRRGEW